MADDTTIEQEEERQEEGTGVPRTTDGDAPKEAEASQRFFSPISRPAQEESTDKRNEEVPEDLSDKSKWKEEPCVADQLIAEGYSTTHRIKEVRCHVLDLEKPTDLEKYQSIWTKAMGPWKSIQVMDDAFPQPGFKVFIKYIQHEFYDFRPKENRKG